LINNLLIEICALNEVSFFFVRLLHNTLNTNDSSSF
jgi:hypothetical protein